MKFRTEIFPENQRTQIGYADRILLMGSCFVENVGQKMLDGKFNINLNPFGVIFNPSSIAASLRLLIDNKEIGEKDLFYHNERWHSFHHHSRFSNPDKIKCLDLINKELHEANLFLKKATHLIITFGTAWIFELADTGGIVSNCHKMPQDKFKRRLLDADEIFTDYSNLILSLKKITPEIKLIFTISPIRHLKDGAENNSLSKAVLRVATDKICRNDKAVYFPSYELLMDDLRDYRFYDSDLCHPSPQAIEYIWEKFTDCYFNSNTMNILNKIGELNTALQHKPFNPGSESYRDFIKNNLNEIELLQIKFPFLQFDVMKSDFEKKLK
jgi:hypothetical protein